MPDWWTPSLQVHEQEWLGYCQGFISRVTHKWLKTLSTTPKLMWMTPITTDIFILYELRKDSRFTAMFQIWWNIKKHLSENDIEICPLHSDCNAWVHLLTGSMPNGYGPLKTPLTLGSNVSKAFVWSVLLLQCKKHPLKHTDIQKKMFLSVCILLITHVHCWFVNIALMLQPEPNMLRDLEKQSL